MLENWRRHHGVLSTAISNLVVVGSTVNRCFIYFDTCLFKFEVTKVAVGRVRVLSTGVPSWFSSAPMRGFPGVVISAENQLAVDVWRRPLRLFPPISHIVEVNSFHRDPISTTPCNEDPACFFESASLASIKITEFRNVDP